ncbi:MAG: SPFH domain-containing protein [Candidatus Poribacteria bacterium]|nr:SPFH domain-containing protein [Candidatus Poribacteria bacterium]MYK16645.1 hypothetical protein [Candidatus Poribacteria bacterium]
MLNANLFITIVGSAVALMVIFLLVYRSFYKKAPADSALVVSGGRKKRVVFGGTLINPLTNTSQLISLNTLQLPVERTGQAALITKDSLRVDLEAQFYVKIEPHEQDVLKAVASLGDKTLTPSEVNRLLEGKLVGVLRSVAATMDLQELHEKRQEFSDQVQEACRDDLEQNGFKLESVAVTNLDQTPLEALDENNRFDVVAIQTIKQEVEDRQTQTARIEHENQVQREEDRLKAELAIKQREEETETQALEVAKRLEFAQEEQRKSIATNKAEQEREIEEARIKQEEVVKSTEILQKQRLDTARIQQERQVQETEIAQKQSVEIARVQQEQTIEEAQIQRSLSVERAKIEQERAVEEAGIASRIVLVEKDREEKEAQAENAIQVSVKEKQREAALIELLEVSAQKARAEASVLTAEAVEEAERQSKIALIRAEQEADEERIAKERAADAEAYAVVEAAKAELDAAEVKAQAQRILAEALLVEAKAKADGEEASIAAKNQADPKVLVSDAILALVESLPEVTSELMKPAERIESIRVLDLGNGGNGNGSNGMNRILSSIVNAGAAVPLFKEIVGFSGVDTEKIAQTVRDYASGLAVETQTDSTESESTDAD